MSRKRTEFLPESPKTLEDMKIEGVWRKKAKLKPLSEVSMPKSKKIQFFRDTQISDKFSLICRSFGFLTKFL